MAEKKTVIERQPLTTSRIRELLTEAATSRDNLRRTQIQMELTSGVQRNSNLTEAGAARQETLEAVVSQIYTDTLSHDPMKLLDYAPIFSALCSPRSAGFLNPLDFSEQD